MAFVNEKFNDLTKDRTIDYDRNIILSSSGGNRENIRTFKLVFDNDQHADFLARYTMKPLEGGGAILEWKVIEVDVSGISFFSKGEVLKVVKESLEEYGLLHNRKGLNDVCVIFSPSVVRN